MSPARTWSHERPATLAGYLEAMSRPVFMTGMSWSVVEAKWDGISDAFLGFDPERVAHLTPADVDRLAGDPRVIRNRKKIEAIVTNAERMIELDREPGGFEGYLATRGSFEETVAALRADFRFLGESGAYIFLYAVDQPVPSHEEWARTHARRAS